ncbi:excisionase family DNA binding protein [Paucibacter oligotrophus]|uniref:Excisionase family DNA binding protein n=1 Tax=Roseateles oligotrophus TaxID=1769250 RepID=A0A840L9N3_9BURK|nr:helix-turn-helix domain-containing protein [Roseateles oligotrophus]MBB4843382.1 excisionase family DNA binding protein [Roseateles oligotrophus]
MNAPSIQSNHDKSSQPLHALQLQDALLRMQTVTQATGLSAATIYRKVAAGELPVVKMGKRCTRFRASDVRAFIQAQGV